MVKRDNKAGIRATTQGTVIVIVPTGIERVPELAWTFT